MIDTKNIIEELFSDKLVEIREEESTRLHAVYLVELEQDKFVTVDFEFYGHKNAIYDDIADKSKIVNCDIEYYDNKYDSRQERYVDANSHYWSLIRYYINKEL